jgi:hypothetical protein
VLRAWPLLLILFAPAPRTAFQTPPPGRSGTAGVRARFAESLSRLAARLDRNPADADAIERLLTLNELLGRTQRLAPVARNALENTKLDEKTRGRIRGVLGVALVAEVNATRGFGNVIIFVNGKLQPQNRGLTDAHRKLFVEAEGHLRAGVQHDNRNPQYKDALAEVIGALHPNREDAGKEAEQLRTRAVAIRMRTERTTVGEDPFQTQAGTLIAEAERFEQTETEPDHMRALEKRKQALVLAFCRDTIPFDFAATLYEQVVLLAPRNLVQEYLTRSFQNSRKQIDHVTPKYHGAPFSARLKLVEDLGKDGSNGADAVLLALIRGATALNDPLAEAATTALCNGEHKSARAGLPLLLAKSLYSGDANRFPVQGQRLLVQLAVRMECKATTAVLGTMLVHDNDLFWPRRIGWALGRLGDEKQSRKLLLVAKNEKRDLSFRREAARACALLDPESALALDAYPELAIALAAARYEATRDDALKGRLLNGFSSDLEIDEAARYCADLGIKEALPAMESFLREFGEKKDHAARLVVVRELNRLNRAR